MTSWTASLASFDANTMAELITLTTPEGQALLNRVAAVVRTGPADVARWRQVGDPALVAAAIRLVEARRRGVVKFSRADRMWLTAKGLEQATAEAVAVHKAQRFAAAKPVEVIDLCSGVGGDAIALAAATSVQAIDIDPAMGRRITWNAEVYGVGDRVVPRALSAETVAISPESLVHVDPDRRAASTRKTNDLTAYAPSLGVLLNLAQSARGGALKLGPACDFSLHFGRSGFEVELVSLRGECKEATAWFGTLARPTVRRRATALPSGATWTDQDDPGLSASSPPVPPGPIDQYVHDPDPALVRSGLLDGFARARGWLRVETGVDLMTGPSPSDSPLAVSFLVIAILPLDAKILRREVAARGQGPLEIKTRGLGVRPEEWRARLRPMGSEPATWLLVAGRGAPGRAILARRLTSA